MVEIQEMARLEIEMMERQSRSREAVDSSVGQWNSLISQRRGIKGRSSRIASTGNTSGNLESNPE